MNQLLELVDKNFQVIIISMLRKTQDKMNKMEKNYIIELKSVKNNQMSIL